MTTITTRIAKGTALTISEVDANFTNLNNDKASNADLTAGLLTKADKTNPIPSFATTSAIPAAYTGVARVGTDLYVGDGVRAVLRTGNKQGTGGRPTVLIVGNSLAGLNQRRIQGETTTLSSDAVAGTKTINLASAIGFTSGATVAIEIGSRQPFVTTQVGAPTGNTITIADRLPMRASSGRGAWVFTTDRPSNIRQGCGPIAMGLQLLGMPCEILNGFGEIGSQSLAIVSALPMFLEKFKPNYCFFIITENDISNSINYLDTIRRINTAVAMCISSGTTPIVMSPFPATIWTAASGYVPAALNLYNYIMSIASIYPQAIGFDTTTLYSDGTFPTNIVPIAGYTDGQHPTPGRSTTIGLLYKPNFASLFGSKSTHSDIAQYYYNFSGTGGYGATGVTGAISQGLFASVGGTGVSAIGSKVAGTDKQKLIVTTTSTSAGDQLLTIDTGALAFDNHLSRRWIRIFCKYLITSQTNVRNYVLTGSWNDGSQFNVFGEYNPGGGAATAWDGQDVATVGNEITKESCSVMVPQGATTLTIRFSAETLTGTATGLNIEFRELGWMMASSGELFDTV